MIGVQAAACAPFAGRAPDRADDRRRDRRQVPGRAHLGDPSRPPRRGRRRRRRGDLPGDRPPPRAVEARRRGCRRRARRRAARRARPGRRACLRRARGRQHRRDDADVGDALRPHVVRPLSRRSHRDPDRPGQLANIVGVIAAERANVLAVTHYREGRSIGVLETEAELTLETRGEEHSLQLVARSSRPASPCTGSAERGVSVSRACRGCDRAATRAPLGEAAVDDGAGVVAAAHEGRWRRSRPGRRSRRSSPRGCRRGGRGSGVPTSR